MLYLRFSTCIPVKGYCRSAVYDLQRQDLVFIPNELYHYLNARNGLEVLRKMAVHSSVHQEYLEMLLEKEIIFETDEDEAFYFSELDTSWDYPALLTNVGIHAAQWKEPVLDLIGSLGANTLVCWIEEEAQLKPLLEYDLSKLANHSSFDNCVWVIDVRLKEADLQLLKTYLDRHPLLSAVHLFRQSVIFQHEKIHTYSMPYAARGKRLFAPNMEAYMESLHFNLYFDRKMFIAENGEIRNAHETAEGFGFIQQIKNKEDLMRLIFSPSFHRYWTASKDKTEVCRDCELRYLCLDSRTPEQREGSGSWYHERECEYNPYVAKWKGEEGYRSLAESGVQMSPTHIVDSKKLEQINRVLWPL